MVNLGIKILWLGFVGLRLLSDFGLLFRWLYDGREAMSETRLLDDPRPGNLLVNFALTAPVLLILNFCRYLPSDSPAKLF
jgi:hypothetical protein